jgi:hypothetical protein
MTVAGRAGALKHVRATFLARLSRAHLREVPGERRRGKEVTSATAAWWNALAAPVSIWQPVAVEARPSARAPLVEQVIRIEGDFLHVSHVLAGMKMLTVRSTNDSHVLFTLPSGAAAVARPDESGEHVEVVVKDATGGIATRVLATQLRSVFDYEIRVGQDPEPA